MTALMGVLDALSSRYRFKVIYVLDRSSDGHRSRFSESSPRTTPSVTVLHLSRRFGHQMSLIAGIDYASGDAVIMMDCDLQHPPTLIPDLLARFEEGLRGRAHRAPLRSTGRSVKRLTSRLFYQLQNRLSPVEIKEGAADFRLVSRRVAEVFRTSVREQNQFLRGLFKWVGFDSAEVMFVSPAARRGHHEIQAVSPVRLRDHRHRLVFKAAATRSHLDRFRDGNLERSLRRVACDEVLRWRVLSSWLRLADSRRPCDQRSAVDVSRNCRRVSMVASSTK